MREIALSAVSSLLPLLSIVKVLLSRLVANGICEATLACASSLEHPSLVMSLLICRSHFQIGYQITYWFHTKCMEKLHHKAGGGSQKEANLGGLTASNQYVVSKPFVGSCLKEKRHIYKLIQSLSSGIMYSCTTGFLQKDQTSILVKSMSSSFASPYS